MSLLTLARLQDLSKSVTSGGPQQNTSLGLEATLALKASLFQVNSVVNELYKYLNDYKKLCLGIYFIVFSI